MPREGVRQSTRRAWRWRVAIVAAAVALCTLSLAWAADIPSMVDAPTGDAPLRYRDEVFDDVTVTRDLQYGSAPGLDGEPEALLLDLYEPTGDTVDARPLVLFAHGGGYSGGDKRHGPSPELAEKFAHLGYVTASINYRLLVPDGCDGNGGVPQECYAAAFEAIHDGQAAVRWMRANAETYRIDPDRIGFGGESAGAITALGVGIASDQPGNSGNPDYASNIQGWISISGGVPEGIFVSAEDAPGYLFHGTEDRVVPYIWSAQTADRMVEEGVPVYLRTFEGADHVPWEQYRDLITEQSINFFYKYLDVDHSAATPEIEPTFAATATPVSPMALPSTGSASGRTTHGTRILVLLLGVVGGLGTAGLIARRRVSAGS